MKPLEIKQFVYLLLSSLISSCFGAKILAVVPVSMPSHFSLGGTLVRELALKGHQVTVISPFPSKTPIENYTDIVLKELADHEEIDMFKYQKSGIDLMWEFALEIGFSINEDVFSHPKIKQLVSSNATFDLVLIHLFFNYAQMAFAHHFKAPLVLFSIQSPVIWTQHILRHPQPFTYVPSLYSGYSYDMNIFQRMHNLFLYLYYDFYEYFVNIPKNNECLKKYMPNSPRVEELFASVDLVLYNSHWSSNAIVPKLPNMIEIGGFHIGERKQLPADVRKFLDEATHGAIYFSMGSLLKSTNFKMETRMVFLAAFRKLKERVIWKWENDSFSGLPENVKIEKWLPQQDILAHPNIRLFITHCGISSTIEAVHFGVPILGIPVFADQPTNCAILKSRGMALTIPPYDISKDTLTETLNELLSNPKYRKNAKFRSEIMKDQEMKPMNRAVFWIEHILRHKGGKHLQAYGIHMPWYEFYMVDLMAIGLAFMVVVVLTCYFVIQKCRRYMIYNKRKLKSN